MEIRLKKAAKWLAWILLVLGLGAGLWCGIKWLKQENHLSWATGTKDKAFLRTTWGMSPHEVERITGHPLREGGALILMLLFDKDQLDPIDRNRLRPLCQDKCYDLWGCAADVSYLFFDRRMYAYEVTLTVYDDRGVSLIRRTLEKRFGDGRVIESRPGLTRVQWVASKQRVRFSAYRSGNETNGYEYAISIYAVYLPLESQLHKTAREEKDSYF